MKISKIPGLGRFGIFIDDVDFEHLADEEWMEIGKLHKQSLVTILRNVNLNAEDYAGWITKFGRAKYPAQEYYLKYFQEKYKKSLSEFTKSFNKNDSTVDARDRDMALGLLQMQRTTRTGKIINVEGGFNDQGVPNGLFAEGELGWHSNEPGHLNATPGVALYGQQGMVGSATGFATTVDYYESVSESFRSELNEIIILHKFTPEKFLQGARGVVSDMVKLAVAPPEGSEVPLVVQSPGGYTGLRYSYTSMAGIKGMSDIDAQKVFKELDRGIFQDKYTYDHWYQQDNDLLLFDNSITTHRRLGPIIGRSALRTVFDYTTLQKRFYQPYINHGSIARKYIRQAKNSDNSPTVIDYLKTFFYKY